jgi:D-alanyl-D-alanine carboxypeptidase
LPRNNRQRKWSTAQVHAKTGTFVAGSESGLILKGQALDGYVDAASGRRLGFELVVNNVAITNLNDVLQVFQDEGTISAILWRDNSPSNRDGVAFQVIG